MSSKIVPLQDNYKKTMQESLLIIKCHIKSCSWETPSNISQRLNNQISFNNELNMYRHTHYQSPVVSLPQHNTCTYSLCLVVQGVQRSRIPVVGFQHPVNTVYRVKIVEWVWTLQTHGTGCCHDDQRML